MKKALSVLLAVLMLFSAVQMTAISSFANDISQEESDEAPVPAGYAHYKPFSYECSYCGETHEGFFGIFITLLHLMLSAFNLGKKAISR